MLLNRKKVMLVDPSPIFRRQLKTAIQTHETLVDVIEADDLIQAEEILSQQQLDAVILDIGFPKGGGIGLITTIKNMTPDVRVVVMTSNDSAAIQTTALENGADYFLSKEQAHGLRFIDVIHEVVRRQ